MTKFKIQRLSNSSEDLYELSINVPLRREVFGSESYFISHQSSTITINRQQHNHLQSLLPVSDDLYEIECYRLLNLKVFKVGQWYSEHLIDAFTDLVNSIKTVYGTGEVGATFLLLEVCGECEKMSFVLSEVKGSSCFFLCVYSNH